MRALRYAAGVYAAAFLFHNGDHVRRGFDTLTPYVLAGGTLLTIASVIVIAMVLTHHRQAPLAAAIVGFAGAVGVTAVHLLPDWGAFSDAFPGGQVDAISYAAVLGEIAAAALLGFAGLHALRGERGPQPVIG